VVELCKGNKAVLTQLEESGFDTVTLHRAAYWGPRVVKKVGLTAAGWCFTPPCPPCTALWITQVDYAGDRQVDYARRMIAISTHNKKATKNAGLLLLDHKMKKAKRRRMVAVGSQNKKSKKHAAWLPVDPPAVWLPVDHKIMKALCGCRWITKHKKQKKSARMVAVGSPRVCARMD
jgi:hypothetical protein